MLLRKSIDSYQPAQAAVADMDRYFSLSLNFSASQMTFLHHGSASCLIKRILRISNDVTSRLVS